jgi:hypothetical protein
MINFPLCVHIYIYILSICKLCLRVFFFLYFVCLTNLFMILTQKNKMCIQLMFLSLQDIVQLVEITPNKAVVTNSNHHLLLCRHVKKKKKKLMSLTLTC